MKRPYGLVRPCPKCPFRSDVKPFLRAERAAEIARGLEAGGEFYCHQTTVLSEAGDERVYGPGSMVCAGALITMERDEAPNQMMRISERLGLYNPARLDMDAPVYDSLAEWVAAYGQARV